MLPDVLADADLVWVEFRVARRHRAAPRALAVGNGPGVERSLLHPAGGRGRFDVPRFENDTDDRDRPAAADNDEDDAHFHGRDVRDFPVFERSRVVYSDQQYRRHSTAVVLEPDAPAACTGKASARQEALEKLSCTDG